MSIPAPTPEDLAIDLEACYPRLQQGDCLQYAVIRRCHAAETEASLAAQVIDQLNRQHCEQQREIDRLTRRVAELEAAVQSNGVT